MKSPQQKAAKEAPNCHEQCNTRYEVTSIPLNYLQKYGVTKVAIRQYIYRWLRRYDGTIDKPASKEKAACIHIRPPITIAF